VTGLVWLAALAPGAVQAAEPGCIPQPAPAGELSALLAISGATLAWIPPVEDQVDPDGYDYGNGDNDGDGVRNKNDALPNDARDSVDTDGDGVGDNTDAFPKDPKEFRDSDCDGIGDNADDKFDGDGRIAAVERWSGDGVYGQNAKFTLATTPDGVMHATLKVKLTGSRNDKREAAWEHEIEKFWSNDSFSLDVKFVESGEDNVVHISRGSGRANSGNWFTATDKWVASHEIGHLLGLNDEYVDRSDGNRLIGESNSIMRANWDGAVPYDRHLLTITTHFDCDKSRPASPEDLAALKDHDVTPIPEPEDRPQVTPPEGTSKYLASGDAFKDAFVKQDDAAVYMTHTRGDWWTWEQTLDPETLQLRHPKTGEVIVVEAGRLSVVVETLPAVVETPAEDGTAAVDTVKEAEPETVKEVVPVEEAEPVTEPEPVSEPETVETDETEPVSEPEPVEEAVEETEKEAEPVRRRPVPPRFRPWFKRPGWR